MTTPQMPQTVLLAQTPGQTGAQTKTIIILQQPQNQQIQVQPAQQQKIIMTPSGQQVIYSSPVQRQTIGQQVIQTVPQSIAGNTIIQNTATQAQGRKIVITNVDSNAQGGAKIIHNVQQQPTPTKIVQHATAATATSQQTLQAIAQGQNIIVQKGQKFQIGSTQISQVISPAQQPQTIQQSTQQIQIQQAANQSVQVQQVQVQQASTHQVQIQQAPQQVPVTQTVQMQTQSTITKVIQKTETHGNPPASPQKEKSPVVETKKDENVAHENTPPPMQESTQVKVENTDSNEAQSTVIKTEETASTEKEKSPGSSGSSSPSPNQNAQNKQTISIQIPVPQSQLVGANAQQYTIKIIPSMDTSIKIKDEDVEPSWLYVCEWRGCPKKKFNSANEVYLHACSIHCPSLEGNPDL